MPRLAARILAPLVVLLACQSGVSPAAVPAAPAAPVPTAQAAELERLERRSAGILGVTAVLLPSGRRLSWRGDATFPMMSTFKLPVALAVVRGMERGALQLADTIHLRPEDLRPGMGGDIATRWPAGGDLTVRELAEAMVEQSDNTACDALLRRVGGPAQVTAMLRELGVTAMRVDRSELELGRDIDAEGAAFSGDPRDQSSPDAMATLLIRIAEGKAAGPEATQELLRWLRATTTGPGRLLAGLPPGTRLLHKTGTYGGAARANATNDVGIVPLRDGSQLVIAAFLRDASTTLATRERVLAEVASIAYGALAPR
jgi:beta-lactamase class A